MPGGRRRRNFTIRVYQKGQSTYLHNSGTKLDPNNICERGRVFSNNVGLLHMRIIITQSRVTYTRDFLWRTHVIILFLALLQIV